MRLVGSHFKIKRHDITLTGDPSRTIVRLFMPGNTERIRRIGERVNNLSDVETENILRSIFQEFGERHNDLESTFISHFDEVSASAGLLAGSNRKKLLIGAYFSMEYSFESAALFNPSMVQAIDQTNVPQGTVRFLMSLRAVGEGHLSSIAFRRGIIDSGGNIIIEEVGKSPSQLRQQTDKLFDKFSLQTKLQQLRLTDGEAASVFNKLPQQFTYSELAKVTEQVRQESKSQNFAKVASRLLWIAKSNYSIQKPESQNVSDLVLFPISESESQGMEDMRLVRFVNNDGSFVFYGTYTAFDGRKILPQLLTIQSSGDVEVDVLFGKFAQNKGLALFGRKINGDYLMLARVDGENNYLLRSKDIYTWDEGQILQTPQFAWEFVQVGNCGSPIETDAGWLLLTHGVGPLRRYCMGAILLDLDDPSRVIGQLREPLLVPSTEEWSGYVPNVVYSCGAMLHNERLYIPYGISDSATGFISLDLDELLDALR